MELLEPPRAYIYHDVSILLDIRISDRIAHYKLAEDGGVGPDIGLTYCSVLYSPPLKFRIIHALLSSILFQFAFSFVNLNSRRRILRDVCMRSMIVSTTTTTRAKVFQY
jgi:hypothetical protein